MHVLSLGSPGRDDEAGNRTGIVALSDPLVVLVVRLD
jgi:hypothetical protein